MEKSVKYHFSIHIDFKKDVDVEKLEKHFGIKAYKLTKLSESKGKYKTAKIWYRTEEFSNVMIDTVFDDFINKIKDNFADLPKILEEYDGECGFTLVIKELESFPYIALTKNSIEVLSQLGADFSVDFLCD